MENELARVKEQIKYLFEKIDSLIEDIKVGIKENKKDIKDMDKRIDGLEVFKEGTNIQITNLIEQMKRWITVQTWLVSTLIVSLLGFFIWYIQNY